MVSVGEDRCAGVGWPAVPAAAVQRGAGHGGPRLAAQRAAARVAQRLDHRPDVAEHAPSVHEHLIELLGLEAGGGGLLARHRQLGLEVGDAQLQLGHMGQPLLGIGEQLGQAVALL